MTSEKEKVDVNRADRQALAEVHGLDAELAESIVRHRETHGEFRSIAEVEALPAVRRARLSDLRDRLTV